MRRLTALLALLLATAALSGCTGAQQNTSAGDFEGADRDVVAVIDDLKASRDPDEICTRFLTQEYAKALAAGGKDCQDEVQATIRDVADTGLDVKKVTISGDSATADVEQEGETATFELERTADGWQISSFGAS
jgi:hypothetical protein